MAYNNRKPRFNRRNDEVPKGAGLYVEVRNNDVEKALRRLKKMIKSFENKSECEIDFTYDGVHYTEGDCEPRKANSAQ